jgi:cytochrome P450
MSEKFVELGVSFFDEDFTLDPFPYLKDLYDRSDVLGFQADGMSFLFRFDLAREVIRSRSCRREPLASAEIEARERIYAERYPNRAKYFRLSSTRSEEGRPDFVTKKLMMDFLDEIAELADFSGAQPIFERLAAAGRIDDYVESVQTLPLRVALQTCGLRFTEAQLSDLQHAGVDFIRAADNFTDETPLRAADAALTRVWRYLEARLEEAESGSLIRRLLEKGRSLGLDDEKVRVNIGGFLVISLANTAGISSAFVLRSLIRHPEVRRELAKNPELIRDDNVITELLRRDNHVKALSRQVHEDFELGPFPMQRGESIYLFFPGVNLDPAQWPDPLAIDLNRRFTGANNLVFGGSAYICIGKKLGIEFLKHMTAGFVEHLPERARVVEDEVEADGSWVVERIIKKLPIVLEG